MKIKTMKITINCNQLKRPLMAIIKGRMENRPLIAKIVIFEALIILCIDMHCFLRTIMHFYTASSNKDNKNILVYKR